MYDDHNHSATRMPVAFLRGIMALMDQLCPTNTYSILNMSASKEALCFHVRIFGFGTLMVYAKEAKVFRVDVAPSQSKGDVLASEPNF